MDRRDFLKYFSAGSIVTPLVAAGIVTAPARLLEAAQVEILEPSPPARRPVGSNARGESAHLLMRLTEEFDARYQTHRRGPNVWWMAASGFVVETMCHPILVATTLYTDRRQDYMPGPVRTKVEITGSIQPVSPPLHNQLESLFLRG